MKRRKLMAAVCVCLSFLTMLSPATSATAHPDLDSPERAGAITQMADMVDGFGGNLFESKAAAIEWIEANVLDLSKAKSLIEQVNTSQELAGGVIIIAAGKAMRQIAREQRAVTENMVSTIQGHGISDDAHVAMSKIDAVFDAIDAHLAGVPDDDLVVLAIPAWCAFCLGVVAGWIIEKLLDYAWDNRYAICRWAKETICSICDSILDSKTATSSGRCSTSACLYDGPGTYLGSANGVAWFGCLCGDQFPVYSPF